MSNGEELMRGCTMRIDENEGKGTERDSRKFWMRNPMTDSMAENVATTSSIEASSILSSSGYVWRKSSISENIISMSSNEPLIAFLTSAAFLTA
jgi:hypothetical protein